MLAPKRFRAMSSAQSLANFGEFNPRYENVSFRLRSLIPIAIVCTCLVSSSVALCWATSTTYVLCLSVLFLLHFLTNSQFAFRMTGVRITSAIRQDYFTALFSQSVHVLDSMPPGYATTIITTTGNTLQLGISEKLGVFVEYNATMIASIIVAFIYSWQLSLVTFTAVVFITFSVSLVLPYITKGQTNQTKVCTDSSILQDVADARVSPKLWRCL